MSTENMVGIAKNKSLMKEYQNRIVYLNNGDEFQIMLFNPTEFKIGAKIKLNGTYIPNMVVLRPGERVWLDRYLVANRKFKFSTYTVDKSNEALNAIINNGDVEVSFYYEETKRNNIIICDSLTPFNQPNTIRWEVTSSAIPYVNTAYYSSIEGATNQLSNLNSLDTAASITTNANYCKHESTMETGRIEEGGISNQTFDNDYSDFSFSPFKTEKIKLLPISQKPFNKNDIEKKYCTECGKKLNSKFKYCPQCGTKVE